MPDRRNDARQGSPDAARTERLNRAIDRMLAGHGQADLNDPELDGLLGLAARLHRELPADLPDPGFRADLKELLTHPQPTPIRRQRGGRAQARFPYVAAAGAIAAVLVAAIAVGALGLWIDDDPTPASTQVAGAANTSSASLATATIALTATTVSDIVRLSATTSEVSTDTTPAAATEPATTPIGTRATTATTTVSTAVPTTDRALAVLPPVDSKSVQTGPVPLASGGSGGPPPEGQVSFVLAVPMPDLGETALAYRLEPPVMDAETVVSQVAQRIGIDSEVLVTDLGRGREVYHADSDAGTFYWYPENGAFQYSRSDISPPSDVTPDEVVNGAREWLIQIGYPIGQLADEARAEPFDDMQWIVAFSIDAMPETGIGHPMGVTMLVDTEGHVVDATGYWLVPTASHDVPLISAEDAWSAMMSGQGYWRDGGMAQEGGELRVDRVGISYVLTSNDDGDLILQPVVQCDGEFTTADGGGTGRVSVFVQAGQPEGTGTP